MLPFGRNRIELPVRNSNSEFAVPLPNTETYNSPRIVFSVRESINGVTDSEVSIPPTLAKSVHDSFMIAMMFGSFCP